jgi:hypothetical protein
MVVVPLSKPAGNSELAPRNCGPKSMSWVSMLAAGTLAAGGALLVSGQRRAGLVTAATGTALAMFDQQETVRTWWNALPAYLTEAQGMLTRVQAAIDDVTAQRERLHKIMSKPNS